MSTPFVAELLRERADRHKPTYTQLRDEGLSNPAIQTMHEARDMLAADFGYYDFAKWFAGLYGTVPLSEADSWPDGKPDHWAAWDEERYGSDFDPTDAELEASWTCPDAHEAHRAAWVLHQEVWAR